MSYSEDEMLQLSGIQHFAFCPRQWALIHVEQQWAENRLTAEGQALHANVDDPFRRQTNGSSVISLRGLRIASYGLGLSGIADVVEFTPFPDAPRARASLIKSGMFTALPIEYKRGHIKLNDCDRLQVAAQCMILEEMLGIVIARGAIFYWEERHREYVEITEDMRIRVKEAALQMHKFASAGFTPHPPSVRHGCRSCSIRDLCMPSISGKRVKDYLKILSDEETT